MSIKITIPNTSSDTLTFGSGNTPIAAQIAGIDSGSSNGQLAIYTTASGTSTERVRVDSSGNVGIGTASPGANLDVQASTGPYVRIKPSTGTSYGFLGFSNTGGSFNIGRESSTGASLLTGSSAYASVLNSFGAYPMQFGTNGALAMTIDSSGNVTVANGTIQTTATADATVGFQLIKVSATVTAGTNKYIQFLTNNGTASTGFIASNGASNAGFFAGSDRRIKTDIHAVSDGVKKVMQLKPSKFKFKENDEQSYGFIAQELNEVFPECVYKPNDGKGDELAQGQEPWAVNLDKLIPYLTAAIQEQQALITALTARITALENK
jgi:hypothetical protein